MRAELVVAEGLPAEFAPRLRALVPTGDSVAAAVETIIAEVAAGGDAAVDAYTERFDTGGIPAPPLRVHARELHAALTSLDPAVRTGIEIAIRNVGKVAAAGRGEDHTVSFDAHTVTLREVPVKRAAVYVPGGRAPYPSTVVMGVVTARAAGVEHVSVCTPPGPDGTINPAVLAACALTGADAVFRMGGAQAIAALAHGTASVEPVDVIVGPGNLFVQEAKRQLSGRVGIDSFAGPSDLLVLLDVGTAPEPVALDLLAQAEHGAGTLVVAASPDRALLETIAERLALELPDSAAVCRLVLVPDMEFGLVLSESFAPEHLELFSPLAEQLAARVTRAGCVFIGTGTAFGDYIAGSNHTLPTDGAARFASALGPQHFRRRFTEVRIADASALARVAAPLARAEGFELHAQSMEIRISEN